MEGTSHRGQFSPVHAEDLHDPHTSLKLHCEPLHGRVLKMQVLEPTLASQYQNLMSPLSVWHPRVLWDPTAKGVCLPLFPLPEKVSESAVGNGRQVLWRPGPSVALQPPKSGVCKLGGSALLAKIV